mmetsp:Transcript_107154/g.206095  ORF Transcript_107154/g.206095 Transcript_107154/m.206095 type:complete len:321 (-) Transcript_107154:187-1149(-)
MLRLRTEDSNEPALDVRLNRELGESNSRQGLHGDFQLFDSIIPAPHGLLRSLLCTDKLSSVFYVLLDRHCHAWRSLAHLLRSHMQSGVEHYEANRNLENAVRIGVCHSWLYGVLEALPLRKVGFGKVLQDSRDYLALTARLEGIEQRAKRNHDVCSLEVEAAHECTKHLQALWAAEVVTQQCGVQAALVSSHLCEPRSQLLVCPFVESALHICDALLGLQVESQHCLSFVKGLLSPCTALVHPQVLEEPLLNELEACAALAVPAVQKLLQRLPELLQGSRASENTKRRPRWQPGVRRCHFVCNMDCNPRRLTFSACNIQQ